MQQECLVGGTKTRRRHHTLTMGHMVDIWVDHLSGHVIDTWLRRLLQDVVDADVLWDVVDADVLWVVVDADVLWVVVDADVLWVVVDVGLQSVSLLSTPARCQRHGVLGWSGPA